MTRQTTDPYMVTAARSPQCIERLEQPEAETQDTAGKIRKVRAGSKPRNCVQRR